MRRLILTGLLGVLAAPVWAANFSGKWEMEISPRPGRTQQVTLILNQVGSDVTGSALAETRASSGSPASTEIHGGRAEDDTLVFYVWTGRDEPAKRVFRGRLSGDEIHFTVTGGPVRFDERGRRLDPLPPQEVTARRTR